MWKVKLSEEKRFPGVLEWESQPCHSQQARSPKSLRTNGFDLFCVFPPGVKKEKFSNAK